jgi:RNA polymerase sigma-70 factor, ECF subfamily
LSSAISEIKKDIIFEELILQAQKGDKAAFRKIVEMHQRFAFSVAFKILLNEEDARDTAQEAFVKLWKNISRYNFDAKFTTWFYKIITNESLDKLKMRKRKERIITPLAETEIEKLFSKNSTDYSNIDLIDIIKKLTDKLSPRQRIVFTLRDLNNIDIPDISKTLDMSVGSVRTNLIYARKRIKHYLTTIYNW